MFILVDRGVPADGIAACKLLSALKANVAASRIPLLMTALGDQTARGNRARHSPSASNRIDVDFREATHWTANINDNSN
jgi:hypothetical protein